MTDIEQKALALVNEIERERGETELIPRIMRGLVIDEALCRAIEQHEAQAAEIEHLRAEAEAHYDRGYYDGSTHPIVRHDALKIARYAIRGLLDIASEENLDSEQAGRAFAALHEIGTALAALEARGLEIRERG
jgi:hypothetical protein